MKDPHASLFEGARKRALQQRPAAFIPWTLHPWQQRFVDCQAPEYLGGGAAGGGKSVALLAKVAQHIDKPGYSALILRRRLTDLQLPGGLLDLSHTWWTNTKAHFHGDTRTWRFPSGARITFGFLEHARDRYRYQGSQFQLIGFDELTQFPREHYEYLFSRLRAPAGVDVPLQMCATSNPGSEGHEWVKQHFLVEGEEHGRVYLPATVADNPSLGNDYKQSLERLGPVLRAQLLHGDWDVMPEGGLFKRDWFVVVNPDQVPRGIRWVRGWDRAASVPRKGHSDPDYTAGVKLGRASNGITYVADVQHFRASADQVRNRIRKMAEIDGRQTTVVIEQEPNASGKEVAERYRRDVLRGFVVKTPKPKGSKVERAEPLAAAVESGDIVLVQGAWSDAFIDELTAFPNGPHDDQVDAAVHAFAEATLPRFQLRWLRVTDL